MSQSPISRAPRGPSKETVRRLLDEDLWTLAEARHRFPAKRADGKPLRPDIATLLRWIKKGVSGEKLEGVRLGQQWFTSEAAIIRFIERRTLADSQSKAV